MEMRDFIFNGIDEETLIDIENSTYHSGDRTGKRRSIVIVLVLTDKK